MSWYGRVWMGRGCGLGGIVMLFTTASLKLGRIDWFGQDVVLFSASFACRRLHKTKQKKEHRWHLSVICLPWLPYQAFQRETCPFFVWIPARSHSLHPARLHPSGRYAITLGRLLPRGEHCCCWGSRLASASGSRQLARLRPMVLITNTCR